MDQLGKIHRKERLKISKITKFQSDNLLSPTIQTSVKFRDFDELHIL